jgi:hypothetical protein
MVPVSDALLSSASPIQVGACRRGGEQKKLKGMFSNMGKDGNKNLYFLLEWIL